MTPRQVTAIAGLALVAAALPGCSTGLSTAATDACNHVTAWILDGQPEDAAPNVLRTAEGFLADANEPRLTEALIALEDAAPGEGGERAAAAEAFQKTCLDLGWDYPEG